MEKESENKLEVIKMGGNASPTLNDICEKKEEERTGHNKRFRTPGTGILPLYLAASMIPSVMSSPFNGIRRKETRKCALPECNIYFTPSRSSETCCTKEHFFILRNIQRERDKIFKVKKKKKRMKK